MDSIFLSCHHYRHLPFLFLLVAIPARVKSSRAPDTTELSSGASSINIRLAQINPPRSLQSRFHPNFEALRLCRSPSRSRSNRSRNRSRRHPVRSKTIYLLDLRSKPQRQSWLPYSPRQGATVSSRAGEEALVG